MRVFDLPPNFPKTITIHHSPILGFPNGSEETSYTLVIRAIQGTEGYYDIWDSVQLPEDENSAYQYIQRYGNNVAHIPCYTLPDGDGYYECVPTIPPTGDLKGSNLVPGACIRRGLEACICVSQTHVLPLLPMPQYSDLTRLEQIPILISGRSYNAVLWYYPLPDERKLVQSVDITVAFHIMEDVDLGPFLKTHLCAPLKYQNVTKQIITEKFGDTRINFDPPILEELDDDVCTITCLCVNTMHLLVLAPHESQTIFPLGERSNATMNITSQKRGRDEDDTLTKYKAKRKRYQYIRTVHSSPNFRPNFRQVSIS